MKKAGKKIKRIAGANKKEKREVTDSGEDLREQEVKPVASTGKEGAPGGKSSESSENLDGEGKYRRPASKKRKKLK